MPQGTALAIETVSPSPSASPTPSATPTPQPRATSTAQIPGPDTFGIAAGLADLSPGELNRSLDDIKSIGVTWVRFDIEWNNIEHDGPGQYNWADYDNVAHGITARGMHALGIIDYTPPWARPADCTDNSKCAPTNPADFSHFAAIAVARYTPLGIHSWEIWNEPNVDDYYKPTPNIGAYTKLLRAAYSAIKNVDPGAIVLTGGTAPARSNGTNIRANDFLAGIYASGGKGAFDAVAHHPYTFPYTVDNAYPGGAWSDLTALHGIMTAHGDGTKKIWATEYGAPTGGPGPMISGGSGPFGDSAYVSEVLQATMATTALNVYRTYPWAGPIFWYTYQDPSTDPSTIENFFGLLRANGSRKPAYDAFRAAIH